MKSNVLELDHTHVETFDCALYLRANLLVLVELTSEPGEILVASRKRLFLTKFPLPGKTSGTSIYASNPVAQTKVQLDLQYLPR